MTTDAELNGILTGFVDGPFSFVHFKQPIIDLSSSNVIGYEVTSALSCQDQKLRLAPDTVMRHMTKAPLVSRFDHKMALEVLQRVVNRNTASSAKWFINVSSVGAFLGFDDRHFLHPSRVVLECTIPVMLDPDDQDRVMQKAEQLRLLGVSIALVPDKTGRYNAQLLGSGLVSYMKTSPALLQALLSPSSTALKANAIYWLGEAQRLHLPVIGFGLETLDRLNALVMLDVGFAQGFSLQRPILIT